MKLGLHFTRVTQYLGAQKERGWTPDLCGGKREASVGSFVEESFAPGTSTQNIAIRQARSDVSFWPGRERVKHPVGFVC